MERGYIDTTRLYVLLTRGNVVGEKILRILGSLSRGGKMVTSHRDVLTNTERLYPSTKSWCV